ncbi:MAG: DM13 domain-containing protein [Catalinimonas sp.]
MLRYLTPLAILVLTFAAACGTDQDNEIQEMFTAVDSTGQDSTAAALLARGTFGGSARYSTTGRVELVEANGTRELRFVDFETDPGPDLKVYFAADDAAADFVSLGNLPATRGNYAVEVPASVDLRQTPYVLVWCERFSELFGAARLEETM